MFPIIPLWRKFYAHNVRLTPYIVRSAISMAIASPYTTSIPNTIARSISIANSSAIANLDYNINYKDKDKLNDDGNLKFKLKINQKVAYQGGSPFLRSTVADGPNQRWRTRLHQHLYNWAGTLTLNLSTLLYSQDHKCKKCRY